MADQNQLPEQNDTTPEKPKRAQEFGGSKRPEPTRYGDWEIGGKCVDF